MRRFQVTLSTTVEIEVNDEVTGWDGKTLLDPTSERWNPGLTVEEIAGDLAISYAVFDLAIGGSDGYADLPDDTVDGKRPWAEDWSVDSVEEVR